jgi:hypothetical protein
VTFELEHLVTGTRFGAALRFDGYSGVAHTLDSSDAVFLYHDVDGPDGRCPRAIDERHAAKNQPIKGAFTLRPRWRGGDRLGLPESGDT